MPLIYIDPRRQCIFEQRYCPERNFQICYELSSQLYVKLFSANVLKAAIKKLK